MTDTTAAATGEEPVDEWGSDLDVAEWLVWYARRVDGKARDVAMQALDENPALRFTERHRSLARPSLGEAGEVPAAYRDEVDPDPDSRCVDCGTEVDGLGPPICRECTDD